MRFVPRLPTLEDLRRPSILSLVAANLIPLAGVLFFGWDLGQVMLLFWAENLVIGVWHVAKLASVARGAERSIVPFFLVHYGLFTLVHGIFVVSIFVQHPTFIDQGGNSIEVRSTGPWVPSLVSVLPGVAALFVSHGVSFFQNFRGQGEVERWRTLGARLLMFAPYPRVVVMHVTILATGFLMLRYGTPVWGLVLLVGLKTLVDVGSHVAQRAFAREAAVQASSGIL